MIQMPKEKPMHNIKRVIRGIEPVVDVVEPVVEPEPIVEPETVVDVVEPEPEPVVEPVVEPEYTIGTGAKSAFDENGFNIYMKTFDAGGKNFYSVKTRHTEDVLYDSDLNNFPKNHLNGEPTWEPETFNTFDTWLPKHTHYIGFGTWIGVTLFYAAQNVNYAYGFDGDPSAFAQLERNLQWNSNSFWGKKCKILPTAVIEGSTSKREMINMKSAGAGNSCSGIKDVACGKVKTHWKVQGFTLPYLMKYYSIPENSSTFVKIDVESYECELLPSWFQWLSQLDNKPTLRVSLHGVYVRMCTKEQYAVIDNIAGLYNDIYINNERRQDIKTSWFSGDDILLTDNRINPTKLIQETYPVSDSPGEFLENGEKKMQATTKINKTLVFTTKNRRGYVRLLAESLEWMKAYEHAHIHVFDDGSTDFDIEDLKDWFPYAQIHESEHRHADMTTRHAFEWFENESEDDILINIDSDTMLHPDWNDFIDTHIERSGVLSLYHSGAKYHKSVNCDDVSCEKKSTGAMGIVMTRHVLEDMLHNMHNAEHKSAAFDWGFVNYFKKKGIKIIVPKNSLALHYGMYGAHGSGNHVEVANTFDFTPFPGYITKKAKEFLKNKKPDKPNEFAIIIVADSNAQNKYKANIENVKCYADHYKYTLIVTDTDSSCKGHFFVKKHCTVRNLMDTHDFKWALVIDGDVAVVNFKRQLTEMVSDDVSVFHGIRFHNNEIMAGIYFIRNDNYSKTYIQDWVNSGYKGFNYDNGALHYHLLDKLAQGVSGKEECKQKGQYSRDLHSYDQFVKCVHEVLSRSSCERRVRIMENSESKPEWIAIDSDRPKGTWTSTSFLHHAMKAPYQLRKAPKCSRSYFEGQPDDWYVSEDEYKKNLKDFWITEKRRDTGFGFDLCEKKKTTISLVVPAIKDDISFLYELNTNVQSQLRQPDELIVILSGTSQKDCVTIKGWTIECFDKKIHQGEARNIGWEKASSDIVTFMDADDTMYPERIDIIHKLFNKNKKLKMLVHGFDRTTSMRQHIINLNPDIDDGHMLYITMKQTQGKQLHLRTDLAHGHVSIQKNVNCPKFVSTFGEDSIFVRECVQTIGDNKEAMAFVRHPLVHYIPRSSKKS